jgi:hypothetical protein
MTSMTIVERVWKELTGTGLTIQTYFPRNAAARDQLQHLTDTFIASGYSHKALLEEIFASPYMNLAPPDSECWESGYALPRIFDPWVTGEEDPVKRNNSVGDAALTLSARTAARSAYGALGWPLKAYGASFPGVSGVSSTYPENPVTITPASNGIPAVTTGTLERQFQSEAGYFQKTTELGFRGFDFQARLGFEDRFGRCQKLFASSGAKDVIDELLATVKKPGVGTVREVIEVLKDRMFGDASFTAAEQAAVEAMLATSFDADGSTLTDTSLRRVCGAMVAAPQSLMTLVAVVPPDTTEVPKLTPGGVRYGNLCTKLEDLTLPDGITVTCNDDDSLTVDVPSPAAL